MSIWQQRSSLDICTRPSPQCRGRSRHHVGLLIWNRFAGVSECALVVENVELCLRVRECTYSTILSYADHAMVKLKPVLDAFDP